MNIFIQTLSLFLKNNRLRNLNILNRHTCQINNGDLTVTECVIGRLFFIA